MRLSVVIPTYKRPESLFRLLRSLNNQSLKPDEVLIVSGDKDSINELIIKENYIDLSIRFFFSNPSVCVQRNKGIEESSGDYICLMDDDVEAESIYLETLVNYLDQNPKSTVACGLFLEYRNNEWTAEFPPKSIMSLWYKRIFYHAVWGNVSKLQSNFLNRRIYSGLQKYYAAIGNGLTEAGWPLVTNLSEDVNACQIYSLGASIFRANQLKSHLFDEILEPSGIGDNYGVSLSLDEVKPISVLKSTYIRHHKEVINRMSTAKSYELRILAMAYFLEVNNMRDRRTHLRLVWSILGNLIAQASKLKLSMAWASIRVFVIILLGTNPYSPSNK